MGKKVIIVNGSPRKNNNTVAVHQAAAKGAESVGAEVEYVDLYDLNFTDCRSCLACKNRKRPVKCKCYWKDEVSPVLEEVFNTDVLILGSPIYYGEPTGQVRSFMVRSTFPAMSYDDYTSVFDGKVDVGVLLTMNAGQEYYDTAYKAKMEEYFAPYRFLNGRTEILASCDTLQVKDYSKYDMRAWNEEHKKAVYESQFPIDLERAFLMGAELSR